MEKEIKAALKQAILKSLPTLDKFSQRYQRPCFLWSKTSDGHWEGSDVLKSSLTDVFIASRKHIEEASTEFGRLFFDKYPQYGKGKLVGCSNLVNMQLNEVLILNSALGCLWERHETFNCTEENVDSILSEFEEFIDFNEIRVRFQSQLINFHMTTSVLHLVDNLIIRKLSDKEISTFQERRGLARDIRITPCEFIIEGEFDGTKTFSGNPAISESPLTDVIAKINTTLRCLRTFKEGPVGTYWLDLSFIKFCPLNMMSYWSHDRYVPPGSYNVEQEEIEKLSAHAGHIFALSEPAIEMACARLADAEARFRPQDQILDAVIGMEALLLAGLASDDRRSELRYRFSINYSSLFKCPEERWKAYKFAKDLYDARSKIAHGDDIGNKDIRLGEETLKLHEVGKYAKKTLRTLIQRFLPESKNAPYKKSEFWERAYFNVPASNLYQI
jgi:hypothetical protein